MEFKDKIIEVEAKRLIELEKKINLSLSANPSYNLDKLNLFRYQELGEVSYKAKLYFFKEKKEGEL